MVTPGPRRRVSLAAAAWATAALGGIALGAADAMPSDDAYYYFEIARNAAHGDGPGFDSLAPTNGFHPLWAALLVPVFWLFGDDYWLPIRVALGLSMLCVAAGAPLAQHILGQLGAPRAGELAAYTWLLNPFSLVLGLRGMEVPLACLLLASSLAWSLRIGRLGAHRARDFAVLGALLGASVLARTDSLLWALAVGLPWMARLARRPLREGRAAAAAVAAGLLVVSPWLGWSWLRTGSLVQSSQQAKQMFDLYGSLEPSARVLLDALWFPFHWAAGRDPERTLGLFGAAALWVLAVCAAALAARLREPDDPVRVLLRRVGAALAPSLLLFLALHFASYLWLFGSYASWYFLPPVLAACLLQGVAGVAAGALSRRRYAGLAAGSAAVLAATTAFFVAPLLERAPSAERREALSALAASLPPGTRVGLWNAGEVGYFFSLHAPALRVVNLDGVVNNALVRLERHGRYEEYVRGHVDLLIESPRPYLAQIIGPERARRFMGRHLRSGGERGGWPVLEVVP